MPLLQQLMPKAGDTIAGRYRLGEELGRGGFGVVFRATQIGLDEDVAIKILLPHVLANADVVGRFEREVKVAKALRHPNTVHILDYLANDTVFPLPFYVMELVDGHPLSKVLGEGGPLDVDRTRHIAVQVLKSIGEAHQLGVVHRDLKPANIMLCEFFGEADYVKVLDFGIAKALRSEPGEFETATGLIVGTPAYMSPEQIRASKGIDGRSDLYALGLIMAECLAGHPIIQTVVAPLILEMHLGSKPLDFPARVRRSPLWPVIKRATAKTLDERYSGAFAMLAALEQPMVAARAPVSADGPSGRPPPQASAHEHVPAAPEAVLSALRADAGSRERQRPGGEPQRARARVVVGEADLAADTAPNPLSGVHADDAGGERQWVRLVGTSGDDGAADAADEGVDPDAETWPAPRADHAAEVPRPEVGTRRTRIGLLLILAILGAFLLAIAIVLALN